MPRVTPSRPATIAAVVAGLIAIPAAASAHPAFNPNDLPPSEAVESVLVVPHGCAPGGGMPGDGDAEPTTELAVQHTEGVTLEPGEVEGWQVSDDGEAWVWSDDGGATTDVIELPVTVTLAESFAAGDELYVRAFQECADGSSFQWVGTPDEEAAFPAVLLAASEGDVGTAEPTQDMDMNTDHGDMADGENMDMSEDGATATDEASTEGDEMTMDEEESPEDATGDATEDEVAGDEVAVDGEEAAAADDGGLSTPLLVLLAVVLVAAVAGLVVRSRNG